MTHLFISFCFLLLSPTIIDALTSDLFSSINATTAFNNNFLDALNGFDSITGINDMVQAEDGSLYLGGNIEAVNSEAGGQSFVPDEQLDKLGDQDMFLLQLAPNGTVAWGKRFGSRGTDDLRAIAVDDEKSVYVAGSISRDMDSEIKGEVLIKYLSNGTRQWVKSYENLIAGDKFNALQLNADSSELLVAGTIGAQSTLHNDNARPSVSAVMIMRANSSDGSNLGVSVGELFNSTIPVLGNGLSTNFENGSQICYIVGEEHWVVGSVDMYNSVVYSFSYPNLTQISKHQVRTQTKDRFTRGTLSNNHNAIYATGADYVSIYAEFDARTSQFDAYDLSAGWSKSIASTPFSNQASIITGAASEYGRDIAVDEYGNVYLLGDASVKLENSTKQESLTARRPFLRVYSPNGTAINTLQSETSQTTQANRMIISGGKILVAGWTLEEESSLNRAWLSGAQLPATAYRKHAEEYVSDANEDEVEDGENTNEGQDGTTEGQQSLNVTLIAAAAGGAVGVLMLIGVAALIISRRQTNGPGTPHA